MRSFKLTLILGIVVVLMAFTLFAEAKAEVYNWKITCAEVAGDPFAVFAERYAELVEERSDGRIKIETFPGGTLGATRDLVELGQMGEVELVCEDAGWTGGFVPQVQVFALNYLWPKENTAKVVYEVSKNGQAVKLLGEKYRNKGFQLLGVWCSGWQVVSSKVPIRSPEDCRGLKHRVMENPIMVKAYNSYGFNTQSLPYGEVYGALQTRLIDSQVQPNYAHWSMGFYEIQDYLTNLWNEMIIGTPVINRDLFDSMPKDLQQILIDSCLDLIEPMTSWSFQRNQELGEKIKEAKPTITFYDLSNEEIVPFKELAWQEGGPVDIYLKIGGEGAKEILDALLADIKTAQKQ